MNLGSLFLMVTPILTLESILLHRKIKVDEGEDLDAAQDAKSDGATQEGGDDGEAEGNDNVQDPHDDIGDGETLV